MIKWAKLFGYNIQIGKYVIKGLKIILNYIIKLIFIKSSSEKLSAMYKGASNSCWKCKREGIFYHVQWICQKAKKNGVQRNTLIHMIYMTAATRLFMHKDGKIQHNILWRNGW